MSLADKIEIAAAPRVNQSKIMQQSTSYPVFSKSYQNNRRYTNIAPRVNTAAEEWFKERIKCKERALETVKVIQDLCKVCNTVLTDTKVVLSACSHQFCADCVEPSRTLFNQCPTCKTPVDMALYEQYNGLSLTIPPYNSFMRITNPILTLPRLTPAEYHTLKQIGEMVLPPVEENPLPPLVIEEGEVEERVYWPQMRSHLRITSRPYYSPHDYYMQAIYNQQYASVYNNYMTTWLNTYCATIQQLSQHTIS